jgi:PAS domain S-box-containing protein
MELSKKRFQDMADSAPVLIWIADTTKALIWVNKFWLDFAGRPMGQEIGNGWIQNIHPEDAGRCRRIYDESFDARKPFELEYRLKRNDGQYRWLLDNGAPTYIDNQFIGYIGSCVDITDRKETENRLRQSEEKYRAIGELINYGVWMCDASGKNLYASESFLKLVGITQQQCSDLGWADVLHPDDVQDTIAAWKSCVATGKTWDREHRFRGADGQWHPILARGVPILDDQGQIKQWVGINLDISNIKKSEEALKNLAAVLEKRVEERTQLLQDQAVHLRQLAVELTQAEQSERRRLAEVLHDHLQQYLVAAKMRLEAEELNTTIDVNEFRIARTYIEKAIEASRVLTAELRPPVLYEGGLSAALRYLTQKMNDQHKVNIQLSILEDVEPGTDLIKIMIYQCVQELLLNAVKYAGVFDIVVTIARLENNAIQATVEDHGKGFDSTQIGNNHSGGFGLFSIRERVRALGGELKILSVIGQGSRFTIVVPDHVEEEVPSGSERIVDDKSVGRDKAGKDKMVVLVADDHSIVRQSIASLLQAQPFIREVVEAENGQDAIEKAEAINPDVILMDINMPILNGLEATKILMRKYPHSKIIGLSVQAKSEMSQAMMDAGAVAYFNKGDATHTLIETIKKFALENFVETQ